MAPRNSTQLLVLVATLLPLISEAFMHHPGMYGSGMGNNNSEKKEKVTKTQAEKLKDPWLWVCIVLFSVCMFYCLRISMQGRWRTVCGQDDSDNANG